jgi:hypothetical protein
LVVRKLALINNSTEEREPYGHISRFSWCACSARRRQVLVIGFVNKLQRKTSDRFNPSLCVALFYAALVIGYKRTLVAHEPELLIQQVYPMFIAQIHVLQSKVCLFKRFHSIAQRHY